MTLVTVSTGGLLNKLKAGVAVVVVVMGGVADGVAISTVGLVLNREEDDDESEKLGLKLDADANMLDVTVGLMDSDGLLNIPLPLVSVVTGGTSVTVVLVVVVVVVVVLDSTGIGVDDLKAVKPLNPEKTLGLLSLETSTAGVELNTENGEKLLVAVWPVPLVRTRRVAISFLRDLMLAISSGFNGSLSKLFSCSISSSLLSSSSSSYLFRSKCCPSFRLLPILTFEYFF